jgi:CheY-like chemotaxis protein
VPGAERAAGLTRQLLAFSRKQILQPRHLELNAVISGVEKMLRRLIGEDVSFKVQLAPDLAPIVADPGQLEQVILNMVVNARDAMPKGGALSITTEMVGATPDGKGPWAAISIRDTGAGMDEQTQRRIFEPFFTTKGLGKGTGLGLSTCYGIVAQSGGFISIDSAVGAGTTFKVHLPIAPAEEGSEGDAAPSPPTPRGSAQETVLVVEDDDSARQLVWRVLNQLGYRVLAARDPIEAEGLTRVHSGAIDLILSDVVMPNGSGPACVERIRASHPRARALFMSGYTDHPALTEAEQERELNFIQKPFAPEALGRKVREVLDA